MKLPPITLGLWEIGGFPFFKNIDSQRTIQLIQNAHNLGITHFDTAPVYGFGHSEKILGQAIKSIRSKVFISTKCGVKWSKESFSSIYKDISKNSILKDAENSLQRLQTDYIDLYLIHWPTPETPVQESIEALEKLKKEGKIIYYGLSNFNQKQFMEAHKYGNISAVQNKFNLLLSPKQIVLPPNANPIEKDNIAFQAYSPLERGILTSLSFDQLKIKKETAINRLLKEYGPEQRKQIEQFKIILKKVANSYKITLSELVMAVTLKTSGISTLIVGSTSLKHIKGAFLSPKIKIKESDIDYIKKSRDDCFGYSNSRDG